MKTDKISLYDENRNFNDYQQNNMNYSREVSLRLSKYVKNNGPILKQYVVSRVIEEGLNALGAEKLTAEELGKRSNGRKSLSEKAMKETKKNEAVASTEPVDSEPFAIEENALESEIEEMNNNELEKGDK